MTWLVWIQHWAQIIFIAKMDFWFSIQFKMFSLCVECTNRVSVATKQCFSYFKKYIHFIIPFGKFGPPYLGKVTVAARVAQPSPTCACWVFLCFRNPPNSDMDYWIFTVRMGSFLCVPIHTGGWAHRQRVNTIGFLTRKKTHFFFSFRLFTNRATTSPRHTFKCSFPEKTVLGYSDGHNNTC